MPRIPLFIPVIWGMLLQISFLLKYGEQKCQ